MLFIADWYLPSASSQTFFQEARVDKSIIRIKSAHKWPEACSFRHEPADDCPAAAAGLGKRPGHQPAARGVSPVEFAIAESLRISRAG